MCRLLGYLGSPVLLDRLLYEPEHSLIVQSYQPREMTAGLLNADGFGLGWYDLKRQIAPFFYKNTLPIWSDLNLPDLSRYVESSCFLATVRSATAGQIVSLNNCQPFAYHEISGIHNGFIENFRETLYRPIRDRLTDAVYQSIQGTTDSEHIFALLINELAAFPDLTLEKALFRTLTILAEMAQVYGANLSANLIVSDGRQMVASRFAASSQPSEKPIAVPTLYWLQDHPDFPESVILASEPLFPGNWTCFPDRSILSVNPDCKVQLHEFV